ncbi:MAG: hypothetical protein H0W61_15970 [Bacteroidetes bacterium]|nr:hypothetical protein [Bacteroidota bacterium]
MTLLEFNSFDLNQKSDLVWEWGHYLTSRKKEDLNIVLFLINDFFAEVHISTSDNKTTCIVGIARKELHEDFMTTLNHNDPFVKVFLKDLSSSRHEAA